MSLPWRDEVGVYLSPRRLVMVRLQRGLRPRCVLEACFPVEGATLADWRAAVDALAVRLADPDWGGAGLRVAVADHWARQAVVPAVQGLERTAERMVYARHWLSQTYGELGDDWQLALGEGLPGRPFVASAIPAALLASLQEVAAGAGVRLLSVQPQLVVAYERWRKRLPDSGWLVTLDEGCLSAAQLAPHGWDRVQTVRIGEDWSAELRRLRAFGRLTVGASAQRVFVDAPRWLRSAAPPVHEDGLEWLEDERP
ncbi:MAG: hypothetical protein RJB26_111, partial [Pseudomonadota bacterium]